MNTTDRKDGENFHAKAQGHKGFTKKVSELSHNIPFWRQHQHFAPQTPQNFNHILLAFFNSID